MSEPGDRDRPGDADDSSGVHDALARFATGVVLLAAHDEEDGDAVFTATSFTSVSHEPPLVLVGVTTGGWMHEVLDRTPEWAVSVLAESHRALAARFAAPQRPSPRILLTGVPHRHGEAAGALVLDGAVAVLECRTERQVEAGDHVLLLGRVLAARTPVPHLRPLLRLDHRYTVPRTEGEPRP
ncbi:MAG: flavin reductase family protein [Actinomycetes bacterium]